MPTSDMAAIVGARVRAGRARLSLTRKQFAAKAAVSERYLNELENGTSNASMAIIAKVAIALGESPASLMGELASKPTQPMVHEISALFGTMTMPEQQALVPVITAWLAERRRASKGIALMGLRGAGKSSLGKMLAAHFAVPLVSVTREVEARAGMSLNEIFNLGGPDAYRQLENDVIADLVACDGRIVLETAGGITANSEIMTTILSRFKTVWLKATPEEHLARVARQGDTRPTRGNPAALDHLKALLVAREPVYSRADAMLDTSGRSIEECFADLQTIAASAFPTG